MRLLGSLIRLLKYNMAVKKEIDLGQFTFMVMHC